MTMTEKDLQRLESAIGRPLSPAVRHFFLNFPPELRTPEDERDPDPDDFELTDDADQLIQMNTPGWGCLAGLRCRLECLHPRRRRLR